MFLKRLAVGVAVATLGVVAFGGAGNALGQPPPQSAEPGVVYAESREMRDVYARLAQGRFRSPGQRLRVLSMLAGGQADTTTLGIRTRTFLRCESRALFESGIDTVRDGSECRLAREVPHLARGSWDLKVLCKKAECVCRQDDFLEDNFKRAVHVADELNTARARDADRKMGREAGKILRSRVMLKRKGKNCYGGTLGGDISIALECREDETLLSTDQSFQVICPALGLKFQSSSPTPPP